MHTFTVSVANPTYLLYFCISSNKNFNIALYGMFMHRYEFIINEYQLKAGQFEVKPSSYSTLSW